MGDPLRRFLLTPAEHLVDADQKHAALFRYLVQELFEAASGWSCASSTCCVRASSLSTFFSNRARKSSGTSLATATTPSRSLTRAIF